MINILTAKTFPVKTYIVYDTFKKSSISMLGMSTDVEIRRIIYHQFIQNPSLISLSTRCETAIYIGSGILSTKSRISEYYMVPFFPLGNIVICHTFIPVCSFTKTMMKIRSGSMIGSSLKNRVISSISIVPTTKKACPPFIISLREIPHRNCVFFDGKFFIIGYRYFIIIPVEIKSTAFHSSSPFRFPGYITI